MATLSTAWPTLMDLKQGRHDGVTINTVNTLTQRNEIITRLPMYPATGPTSHRFERVKALPTVSWTGLNEGVSSTKGTMEDFEASIKTVESLSEIPTKTLNIQPDKNGFRSARDNLHAVAIANEFASKSIYGDSSSDAKYPDGWSKLMPSITTSGPYVIDNGGTATLTSLYVIDFGPGKNFCVYPREHTSMGMVVTPKGEYRTLDSNSKNIWVYGTHFQMDCAFINEDTRTIGRLANINSTSGGAGDFDEDALLELLSYFDDLTNVAIFSNRAAHYQITKGGKDKANVSYEPSAPFGITANIAHFAGVPILRTDAIVNTETQVS